MLGNAGWQDYALSDGQELRPLGEMAQPSRTLGALGMPAFTAAALSDATAVARP